MTVVLVGALAACSQPTVGSARPGVVGPDYAHPRLVWTTTADAGSFALAGLSFSPDGRTLAVAGSDVTVWDVGSRRLVARLPCDGGFDNPHATATAFSPDGRILAVSGACGPDLADAFTLRLFDMADHHVLATLPDTATTYGSLAFSPDSRLLVAGGDSTVDPMGGVVDFYDPVTRQASASVATQFSDVGRIALSPDGRTVALTASEGDAPQDNAVQLMDVAARRVSATLLRQEANDVAFSPDGRLLAATVLPDSVQLWDVASRTPVRTLVSVRHNAAAPFVSMAFSPDGRVLTVGDTSGGLTFWDVASGRLLGTGSCGCDSGLFTMAYNRDGAVLAAGTGDGHVVVWAP